MVYAEEDFRMISELQHFAFCRRQWALIHLEQEWSDNFLTAPGSIIHRRAHSENFTEKRSGLLTVRGLRVFSPTLGVSGQCDVVEFTQAGEGEDGAILQGHTGKWRIRPVEYKRGRIKADLCDALQLCCQAMCLEEMLGCPIPCGFIYYFETRHRTEIAFDAALRKQVADSCCEIHEYVRRKYIPRVKVTAKCKSCSLKDICLPKLQCRPSINAYYHERLTDKEDETTT